jgi:hypothetical protein
MLRIDTVTEIVNGSPLTIPHQFRASPQATTTLLRVHGEGVLRDGDSFRTEGPDLIQPKAGAFALPPSGMGRVECAKGRSLLRVEGLAVATLDDDVRTCDERRPVAKADAVCLIDSRLLNVEQSPALTGQ